MKLKLGIQARYGPFSNRLDFGVNRCIDDLCRGQKVTFSKITPSSVNGKRRVGFVNADLRR